MRKKSKLITRPAIRRAYDADGHLRVVNCECDAEFSVEGSREYPVRGKFSTKCTGCNLFPWFRQVKKPKGDNGKENYYIAAPEDGVDQL